MKWVMQGAVLAGLAACAGSDTTTTTSEAAAALDTAQCTYQSDHAVADACFQAFQACITATGADEAACRATLNACLPPPPPGRGPHGPPPPDFDGGLRPPPPPPPDFDGGLPPPPPGGPHGGGGCDGMGPPPGGEGPRGPGGPGGPGGGGPLVQPDPLAVQACHDALDACLAATPGDASCFQAEHDCMHAAFDAAFQALCSSITCDPATDADCARLVQRCTEGVGGRPDAFDGGTCP